MKEFHLRKMKVKELQTEGENTKYGPRAHTVVDVGIYSCGFRPACYKKMVAAWSE